MTPSATPGTGSTFVGNILATSSITVNTSVTGRGRALARNAPSGRAWDRGRPRHHLSVGAALHTTPRGCGRPTSSDRRRPLVCGRDVREVAGRWRYVYRAVDQYRPDHRRARLSPTRSPGSTKVLRQGSPHTWRSGGSGGRSGPGVTGRDRRGSSRPRFTTPPNTRTTVWSATTADSKPDCVRCADSNSTIRPE